MAGVRQVPYLGERLGPDHRADRDPLGRVEDLAWFVAGQERVNLFLGGHVGPLEGVGEQEAVHAHHHRDRQFLGDPERLDMQVERFLIRLGVELDPARVPL